MTGILMLESLTRGNTLKQGDKTPLTYKLLDADGDNLNVAGKTAIARLVHPNYLTIGYEKSGLLVSQDDTVTFTIDNVIPARKYNVEIIVDNKFVFPSRSVESKFTIDKSTLGTEASIIEIVGVDEVVRRAVDLINIELPGGGGGGSYDDTEVRAHMDSTNNPHDVTKSQVGLGNVDNTSDANKPVSTAIQSALNAKADKSQVLTDVPANAKFTDTTYTAGTGIDIAGDVISATGGGSGAQLAETAINVRSYGATGDGETDDSEAIQRAIQDLPKENGVLYFPPGEYIQGDGTNPHYVLDSDDNFVMDQEEFIGKDIRFVFDGYKNLTIYGAGAVVKAHPDNSNILNNEGFVFLNSENVYVEGLTYDGSIESRKPTALDIWKFNHQHGFHIRNTKNMLLTNVTSDNTVMDGFYIATGSSDITLVQCKGRYNYRQGASVVKANRVRFYGCDFSYTGTLYGTLPKTGIDVEDDPKAHRENRDVLIEGCFFKDNAGDGVVLHLGTQNAIVRDNTFINNRVVVASDNLFEIRDNDIVGNSFINGGIHARGGGEYIANNTFKINQPTEAIYVSSTANVKGKLSRNVIVENNSVEVELPSPSALGNELYGSITLNQGAITYRNNTHLNINGGTSVAFRGPNIQVFDNEWRFDDDRYALSDVTNFIFASSLVKYANNKVSPLYGSLYGSLIGIEKSLNISHEGWTTNAFRVYDLPQSSAIDLYIPKNSEVVELTISGSYHEFNGYGVRKEILTPNAQPKKTLLMGTKTMVQNGVRISSVYEKEGKDCITLFAEKQPAYFFIKVDVLLNGHITPSYIKNDWHFTSPYTYDTSSNLDFKTVYHSSLNWTGESYERPSAENGFDDILEGAMFYDTTIKKHIRWNGENWVAMELEGLLNEATGTRLKYWAGSQAEYDAIGTYDLETVYDIW